MRLTELRWSFEGLWRNTQAGKTWRIGVSSLDSSRSIFSRFYTSREVAFSETGQILEGKSSTGSEGGIEGHEEESAEGRYTHLGKICRVGFVDAIDLRISCHSQHLTRQEVPPDRR